MTAEDGWYPVALSAGLDPGTSAGTRLFGRELVVWRDEAGAAHVWADRCPHRGMRLSFGFVRGGHIACLYHGWQFDAAGQCRFIPAHPRLDVPDTIRVDRFASVERLGIVWVYSGAAEAAPPPPRHNGAAIGVRSITILAPEAEVMATLRAEPDPIHAGTSRAVTRSGTLVALRHDGLFAALQPLSASETCLHVVIGAPAPGDPATFRAVVSTWAETVRAKAEAAAPGGSR